jgi:molecular chaperone IbpA
MTLRHDFPFRDMMIGFDQFFDSADRLSGNQKYPPFNIEKRSGGKYLIEIALAGWKQDQIDIQEHQGTLIVKGSKKTEDKERDFVYKGIGNRAFTREFKLIDHMVVKAAAMADGVLGIALEVDTPEELKPKKVKILGTFDALSDEPHDDRSHW